MNILLKDRKWYKSILSIRTDSYGNELIYKAYRFPRGALGTYFMLLATHEYKMLKAVEDLDFTPRAVSLSTDSLPAISYGLIEGASIKEMAERGRVPEDFFSRLLGNVKTLYQHGVAHMDLGNSGNILVSGDGHPVIIDFGAALPLDRMPLRLRHWACRKDIVGVLKLWYRFDRESMSSTLLDYYQKHYRKNVYTPKRFLKAARKQLTQDNYTEGRSGLAIISVVIGLLVLMSMSMSMR